jgi:hypothetical protein
VKCVCLMYLSVGSYVVNCVCLMYFCGMLDCEFCAPDEFVCAKFWL